MKKLLVTLIIFNLLTISCMKNEKFNQPEYQSKRGGGGHHGGSGGGGGVDNNLPAPTGLTAVATSPTSITLKWDEVPNATGYWIRRYDGVIWYVVAIVQNLSYTDASVKSGTTYTYKIAAVINSVLGPDSVPVTVTTP